MSRNSDVSLQQFHIGYLFHALDEFRNNITLNRNDKKVVICLFSPYRSNFIAPDHLRSGLAQDILTYCYRAIDDSTSRTVFNFSIVDSSRGNGLIRQRAVFNERKKVLNSMNLSAIFFVLAVAYPVSDRKAVSKHHNS